MADKERDIMEDWLIVQKCPKCGLKRLMISQMVYYTGPLTWVYTCGNGSCSQCGEFGYKDLERKEIVLHR